MAGLLSALPVPTRRRAGAWIPDRAAYNYAEYLPERSNMMKFWCDYLDNPRAGKMNIRSTI
jgi:hypothetical protein